MLQRQIINVPINTQYTYYFFLNNSASGQNWGQLLGITFTASSCKISKNGGSFANSTNAPSEIAQGWYKVVLTATEMNAQDILLFIVGGSGSSEAVWICTTAIGPSSVNANVTQWAGTNVVTPDVAGEPKVTVSDKTGFSLASGQIKINKNTALANFTFLMVDSSGAPKTGLTVAGQVSIDGAAFVNLTNAVSEIGIGVYKVSLAAADTNGNTLMLAFTATGANARYLGVVTQA